MKADAPSAEVIHPYLNGAEALRGIGATRYVIDFEQRNQLEAAGYPAAFDWVQKKVLPSRIKSASEGKDKDGKERTHHKGFLARWWQLSFGRGELLASIDTFDRYIACSRVTKRPVFLFVSTKVRPGDALSCFAFECDCEARAAVSQEWTFASAASSRTTYVSAA